MDYGSFYMDMSSFSDVESELYREEFKGKWGSQGPILLENYLEPHQFIISRKYDCFDYMFVRIEITDKKLFWNNSIMPRNEKNLASPEKDT